MTTLRISCMRVRSFPRAPQRNQMKYVICPHPPFPERRECYPTNGGDPPSPENDSFVTSPDEERQQNLTLFYMCKASIPFLHLQILKRRRSPFGPVLGAVVVSCCSMDGNTSPLRRRCLATRSRERERRTCRHEQLPSCFDHGMCPMVGSHPCYSVEPLMAAPQGSCCASP